MTPVIRQQGEGLEIAISTLHPILTEDAVQYVINDEFGALRRGVAARVDDQHFIISVPYEETKDWGKCWLQLSLNFSGRRAMEVCDIDIPIVFRRTIN